MPRCLQAGTETARLYISHVLSSAFKGQEGRQWHAEEIPLDDRYGEERPRSHPLRGRLLRIRDVRWGAVRPYGTHRRRPAESRATSVLKDDNRQPNGELRGHGQELQVWHPGRTAHLDYWKRRHRESLLYVTFNIDNSISVN